MSLEKSIMQLIVIIGVVSMSACKTADRSCLEDSAYSTVNNDEVTLISSRKCGAATKRVNTYTGYTAYESGNEPIVSGDEFPVTVDYKVFEPNRRPLAAIVLFTGGTGDAGIDIDPEIEKIGNQNNFLVRSAQLFAEKGYLTIVLDNSSVEPFLIADNKKENYDIYRILQFHSMDIVRTLNAENKYGLPVYFLGTSRGALSAYSQSKLSNGISLSSPVTGENGQRLYLSTAGSEDLGQFKNLSVDYVSVPTQIVSHKNDNCAVTMHAKAYDFFQAIDQVETQFVDEFGEKDSLGDIIDNPCCAKTFHGFLGIENAVIDKISTWLAEQVAQVDNSVILPTTSNISLALNMSVSNTLDISENQLVSNMNKNYELLTLYPTSLYGASLEMNNGDITYKNDVVSDRDSYTDAFIYLVKSSKNENDKIGYGLVTVEVKLN